jgi:hypothetical protein
MTTKAKTAPKRAAVISAEKKASLPKRQVVQHTKLLQANLLVEQSAKNDALAAVDRDLAHAAGVRDEAREAARRACDMACALADQTFEAIRGELDSERTDIIRSLEGIDAALDAIRDRPTEPSNVVAMAAE